MSAAKPTSTLTDTRPKSIFDRLTARPVAAYAALTFLCALLFLPGLSTIPPTDRDESRFMQASKQMMETGDYINIRFQNEPRNKKPAGIYWLQTVAVQLTGADHTAAWPYRLPSVIAAWLAVLGTYYLGCRLFDRRTGLIAGGMLATTFMTVIEAHIAKTDATLLAATTVAMSALALMYARREEPPSGMAPALIFWCAVAVGTLIKGPVSLAVGVTTIIALAFADKNIAWLKRTRPLLGLPLALVMTLPWLLATSGNEGENNFFVEAVRGDLIPKLIGGQEGHGAPPGAHLAAGFITAWPWSLLLPFALVVGWRHRTQPAIRFCLAWLLSTWVLFELVPTKLPHYTLPAFPALVLLTAWALQRTDFVTLMRKPAGWVFRGLWLLVTIGLAGGIVFASLTYGESALVPALIAATGLGAGAVVAVLPWRDLHRTAAALALAAIAFTTTLSAGVIPRLSDLSVSARLAAAIAPHRMGDLPVAIASYSEPSVVFLLGTPTLLTGTARVADYVLSTPGAIGVIEQAQVESVAADLRARGGELTRLADVDGFNYSRGDPVHLSVIVASYKEAP